MTCFRSVLSGAAWVRPRGPEERELLLDNRKFERRLSPLRHPRLTKQTTLSPNLKSAKRLKGWKLVFWSGKEREREQARATEKNEKAERGKNKKTL